MKKKKQITIIIISKKIMKMKEIKKIKKVKQNILLKYNDQKMK